MLYFPTWKPRCRLVSDTCRVVEGGVHPSTRIGEKEAPSLSPGVCWRWSSFEWAALCMWPSDGCAPSESHKTWSTRMRKCDVGTMRDRDSGALFPGRRVSCFLATLVVLVPKMCQREWEEARPVQIPFADDAAATARWMLSSHFSRTTSSE